MEVEHLRRIDVARGRLEMPDGGWPDTHWRGWPKSGGGHRTQNQGKKNHDSFTYSILLFNLTNNG